jgi:hypothetical protein
VGTALIQEWRFNQYCRRLQNTIIRNLDQEFKMFMRWRGINIDNSLFELRFNEPQNFAKYRQVEIDTARIGSFGQLEQLPYMSKRFMLSRFLGLTEEEITENERMWREERGDKKSESEDLGLRAAGVTPGGLQTDLQTLAPEEGSVDMAAPGGIEAMAPGAAPPGAAAAAPAASMPGGASPVGSAPAVGL